MTEKPGNRLPWPTYFLRFAQTAATRSSCPRLSVGGVLTKHNRVIATAYNGAPAGEPTCLVRGCDMDNGHCRRARHAEENLITVCARYGIDTDHTIAYITHEPCHYCCGLLTQAGVLRAVYAEPYPPRDLETVSRHTVRNGLELVFNPIGE